MYKLFKDWAKVIPENTLKETLRSLINIYSKTPVYPDKSKVFRAFEECPYNDLKVVILGEDPYPQKGIATGLAFANENNISTSKSLSKIIEALEIEENRFDKSLVSWAKQGILLLNSALTVEENKSGSHILLWRPFIKQLLLNLQDYNPGLIFVLLGSEAQSFEYLLNPKICNIIKDKHPAYYVRTHTVMSRNIFDKVNEILYNNNGYKINW